MSDISAAANQSLVDRWFPPTRRQIAITAVLLALFFVLVVSLDGAWAIIMNERAWSRMLIAPTIIIYILIIGRVLIPFQTRAVESLRTISDLSSDEFEALVQENRFKTSRGAAPALILGFLFGFIPSLPWVNGEELSWISLYFPLVTGLMFGLLLLVIQQSASEGRLSSRILQGPLDFDIFYISPFIPIGLNGLAGALAFVGGSTIVVFFSAAGRYGLNIVDIILHGLLMLITLFIFFMTLRPTHSVLRAAKLAEQDNLKRHMAEAYRRLEAMTIPEKEDILAFSTEVNLWRQYEERLAEVPTWPYNAGMIRTLFVSILLPILVTFGQRVAAYLLVELGIN